MKRSPDPQYSTELAKQNVPDELKARRQWVTWRLVQDDAKPGEEPPKPRKLLFDPKPDPSRNGRIGSSTDPTTWGTFDEACEAVERDGCNGIGFVFTDDDPYCGFDFDKVLEQQTITAIDGSISIESPRVTATVQAAIDLLAPYGYCEISPSGTGLHIILKGTLPAKQRTKNMAGGWKVEAYSTERFFTVTGEMWGRR